VDKSPYKVETGPLGIRLVCQLGDRCGWKTGWWSKDDGSAQEQLYSHKWRAHEPETVAN
jgi:hypothetical protein